MDVIDSPYSSLRPRHRGMIQKQFAFVETPYKDAVTNDRDRLLNQIFANDYESTHRLTKEGLDFT